MGKWISDQQNAIQVDDDSEAESDVEMILGNTFVTQYGRAADWCIEEVDGKMGIFTQDEMKVSTVAPTVGEITRQDPDLLINHRCRKMRRERWM